MKKVGLLFVILTIVFLAIPLMAQTQLGVIGGVNIANLSGEDENGEKLDFSSRSGLGFGGVLALALSENVSLVFEPMYLQKGATEKEQGVEATYKLAYLEVPAFLRLAFGTTNTRPYLIAGASFGFRMSADLKASEGVLSAEVDIKDVTNSTDFGLGFGGGVNFKLENVSLFLEARYALGLSDTWKGGTITFGGIDSTIPDANIKTSGIQIMGGVTFPLGQ